MFFESDWSIFRAKELVFAPFPELNGPLERVAAATVMHVSFDRTEPLLILLPEDHERWLTGSIEDVLALQAGYPSQMMGVA